jgi:site-specific DNA-cytosine methylase
MQIRLYVQVGVTMSRVDTSSCSDSDGSDDVNPPHKTVSKAARTDEPVGSRMSTSSEPESSAERPRGRGNRGRGSRGAGRGKRAEGSDEQPRGRGNSGRGSRGAGRGKRGGIKRGRGSVSPPRPEKATKSTSEPRIPTSSDDDSSASNASSEVSRETARILEAARVKSFRAYRVARAGKSVSEVAAMAGQGIFDKRAAKANARKHLQVASDESSNEPDASPEVASDSGPVSSGVFDYIEWVVMDVLTDGERDALCKHSPISIGSMCSGMGTEDFACRAIVDAMLRAGREHFETESVYKAECDERKIEFLKRHRMRDTQIFPSNAALAQAEVENVDGQIVARPASKVLTAGIVCIDISGLSTTPQPVSGHGKSGTSLQGLLESLRSMSLVERPVLVVLECVPRLMQHRKVDPDQRTGAKFIADELEKLGYIGEWQTARPSDYFLPQSRDRVYGLFLLRDDFTEASTLRRQRDLEQAKLILRRMRVSKPESLARLLSRHPSAIMNPRKRRGQTLEDAKKSRKKWPQEHQDWADSNGLSREARVPPLDFVEQISQLIPPRAMDALWLKLARMQIKCKIDWRQPLLIAPTDFSITWGQVWKDKFPCVTPGSEYLILEAGKARLADGLTMMAMQGIQSKEVQRFKLAKEEDKLLRDLAGNAFTANIIAAFLLAGALVM